MQIGYHNGHDALVLSAFGCGAFGNPPADIARLFHEVLGEPEFTAAGTGRGCFKHVSFAVIDDQNAGREHNPKGNFLPFLEVFGGPAATQLHAAAHRSMVGGASVTAAV